MTKYTPLTFLRNAVKIAPKVAWDLDKAYTADRAFQVKDRLNRYDFIRNTYVIGVGILAVAAIGIGLGGRKIISGLEKAAKGK